jgi:hypothetical protein
MQEILPPQTEDGAGFEPTRIRQFTVFLENRVGRLQQLVRTFEENDGRVVALSVHNSADTALVRGICADPDRGRELLTQNNFPFAEQELLAVELPKKTRHPLVLICSSLLSAEINIYYAYPLLTRPDGPVLAIYVDDLTLAAQVLIRKGFTLIGESDLKKE